MKSLFKKNGKKCGLFRKAMIASSVAGTMANATAATALADWTAVNISSTADANASSLMGNIIGILLTITRYVGIALVIYGVYEIVMSFMQNQPEAKTKGIIMAMAGVVMIGLKTVLQTAKII